ncbi:MAG: NF038122 family metalloprotease [Phycisphaeraceae bacterium]
MARYTMEAARRWCPVMGLVLLVSAQVPSAQAAAIEVTPGPVLASKLAFGTPTEMAEAGVLMAKASTAAAMWSSFLLDPITIKFAIDYDPVPIPGVLGYFDVDALGVTGSFDYTEVKTKLGLDITSPEDATAVGSLQPGTHLNMVSNVTTATPSFRMQFIPGTHDFTFNSELRLTRANQKALGLLAAHDGGPGADGTIKINSLALGALDLTPGPGVDPGKLDPMTIVAHEMGHALGFIGGVDHIDFAGEKTPLRLRGPPGYGTDLDLTDDTIFTVLDLFRYSHDSIALATQPVTGAVLDWAFDQASPAPGEGPYFSIDAGATMLALFSTGSFNGDGYQAQHWKDSDFVFPAPPLGLMDPDLALMEILLISPFDLMAMDAIGYDLVIPEPASALWLALFTLSLAARRTRSPAAQGATAKTRTA